MIKKIYIQNYKIFKKFELGLNTGFNILVGDNEVGKSTILEAINLALTKRLNGRLIEYELTPYLFNACVASEYIDSIVARKPIAPPEIIIELYLENNDDLASLRGTNNSKKEDCVGVKLEIVFDEDYKEEYESLIHDNVKVELIPTEYYKCQWYSFDHNALTARGLNIRSSYIDATTIRLQSGTDYYLQDIIRSSLDAKERAELNIAYRGLKEAFAETQSIRNINDRLIGKKGAITEKDLSISMDISQKSNWETNLVPHLDKLPFQLIGKGEQSALKILLALDRKATETDIVLIEEPENHLSFSSMNSLISKVKDRCLEKQIILTTHSAYVLNKLGLENLILLGSSAATTLRQLPGDTLKYFRKLSGYDTLRLVLARIAILVEGPSDELIVQKAYLQEHGKLPIEERVDVINVRGLSFRRFLDIAKELNKEVVVVTDNDADYEKNVQEKYKPYSGAPTIRICASTDELAPSLEPQLLKSIGLTNLSRMLDREFSDDQEALDYMCNNKTECALRIFDEKTEVAMPEYIRDAVKS